MEWLTVGLVLAAIGFRLASWARAKNIRIERSAWTCIVLGVLAFALMVMDFRTLTLGTEPIAAQGALWVYGIPGLLLTLIAAGLVWRQNNKPATNRTEG